MSEFRRMLGRINKINPQHKAPSLYVLVPLVSPARLSSENISLRSSKGSSLADFDICKLISPDGQLTTRGLKTFTVVGIVRAQPKPATSRHIRTSLSSDRFCVVPYACRDKKSREVVLLCCAALETTVFVYVPSTDWALLCVSMFSTLN